MAKQQRRLSREIAEYAAIIAVVLIGRTALAEARYIPSGSMEPTLLIGDEIVSTKYAYGYSVGFVRMWVV